jgi:hypothetical protein
MCARCPGVHRVLGSIADTHDGVMHLDVDSPTVPTSRSTSTCSRRRRR